MIYVKTKKETHFKIKHPFTECHQILGKMTGMEECHCQMPTLYSFLSQQNLKNIDWPFREAHSVMKVFIMGNESLHRNTQRKKLYSRIIYLGVQEIYL